MSQVLTAVADTDRARRSADRAASDAGCTIAPLDGLAELADASDVFSRVWGRDGEDPLVPPEMFRALTHAGNYAAGAYVDGGMVGAILGFLGQHDGEVVLHSHVMGFLPEARGRGMGFALKLDQRAWALERGITRVSWTFDPLVRANAYFNLTKLGAEAAAYYPDFYGAMQDEINGGGQTDRLLATWRLTTPRAVAASEGRPPAFADDVSSLPALLEGDGAGRPIVRRSGGPAVRCQIPRDIVAVRRDDPDLAREWRLALRATLGEAMQDGYQVAGLTRSGWYVLDEPARS